MTSEEVGDRLDALREAGCRLRRRPASETRDALGRALDRWRDPSGPLQDRLARELAAEAGFAEATVREGLARGLAPWSGRALRDLVSVELGGRPATGFPTTAVLLAGSIPMPTFLALVAPLALGSPVLAKTAARDRVSARHFVASIAEEDAELADCALVLDLSGDDADAISALLSAECVVATGSDETVAAVASRVAPPRRFVGYGHRLSVAALGPEACRGRALARAAEGLALDVALWDQLGCLSPIAVYATGAGDDVADGVAEALGEALATVSLRLPPGEAGMEAAALLAHERADAELRAAAGARVSLLPAAPSSASRRSAGSFSAGSPPPSAASSPPASDWTVVREASAEPRPSPLHRFVRVHPVKDGAGLVDALRPLGPHLAGVALAGFGSASGDLSRALVGLGASRICAPGTLQAPPLDWPRDGRGALTPIARLAAVEGVTD